MEALQLYISFYDINDLVIYLFVYLNIFYELVTRNTP